MKKLTSQEIREIWIKFFKSKKHYSIDSSSLIPFEDESLLWINSGVATLKPYFEGKSKPPNKTLVNIQRAIRTNDIEIIGKTTRHHTLFEMMGSFSIGDYFKKDAIKYAFELLTSKKWFNIPLEKLYFTVYEKDKEALEEWQKLGVSRDKIFLMGDETNFWNIGKGPCGPSTEIFFDKGTEFDERDAKILIQKDIENDRYIEIWNIVFSQFNNDGKNNFKELPQKNIDTGAGLERFVSIFQNTPSNFETDLFLPIIKVIESYSKVKYEENYIPKKFEKENKTQHIINSHFKAISDFSRTIVFSIADGAMPSSTGRGYVIRRLIRKCYIHGIPLGIKEKIIVNLIDIISKLLKDSYPHIQKNKDKIKKIISKEEEQFSLTLTKGIKYLTNLKKENNINEKTLFTSHDTYGMPIEWINEWIDHENIKIDKEKIKKYLSDHRKLSKDNKKETEGMTDQENTFMNLKETNFIGYNSLKSKSKIIDIQNNIIALDKTPFYATSGGQEYDLGLINDTKVLSVTKNSKGVFLHKLEPSSKKIKKGDIVIASIDKNRREKLTKNHSATHLLFSALEKILNNTVPQVGSKVSESFLRFDLSSPEKITQDIIDASEEQANKWISKKTKTYISEKTISEAKKMNATFLENVKYKPIVRVVKLNDEVIDLCGGTHVKNLSEIEQILIINFERRGSGVYRVEAITGNHEIQKYLNNLLEESKEKLYLEIQELKNKFISYSKKIKDIDFLIQNLEFIKNKIQKFNKIKITKKIINIFFDENIMNINKIKVKFNTLINKQIDLIISDLFKNNNNFLKLDSTLFDNKIINKIILNKIENLEKKIILNINLNKEKNKGTTTFILSKDLINNDLLIKKIIKITKENNLRGNGKHQQYIFGGSYSDAIKIYKTLKIWEF